MSRPLTLVSSIALVAVLLAWMPDPNQETRVFELRTYTATESTIDLLHKRFRDHTNDLFVKHGMELVGYWTPTEGDTAGHTLVYMLAYPSREARDRSWQAFIEDPVWQAAFAASREEAGGPLVTGIESTFLAPTDYSPIK